MKKIALFLLSVILLSACYKDIDLYDSDNYQPKTGLNSLFYTDSTFRIYVYKTAPPGEFSADNILKDARVILYEDGQYLEQAVYKPVNDAIGYYQTTATPRNGHIYSIEATYNGHTIRAHDTMPEPADFTINNVEITYKHKFSMDSSINGIDINFILNISINDTTSKKYYIIGGYINGEFMSYPDSNIIPNHFWIYLDEQSQGLPWEELGYTVTMVPFDNGIFALLLNPELFTQDKMRLSLKASCFYNSIDTTNVNIHILVMKLSKNLYDFYHSEVLYYNSLDNPFVEPVNVRVNVDGGLGIFAGMSIAEDSVKVRF